MCLVLEKAPHISGILTRPACDSQPRGSVTSNICKQELKQSDLSKIPLHAVRRK